MSTNDIDIMDLARMQGTMAGKLLSKAHTICEKAQELPDRELDHTAPDTWGTEKRHLRKEEFQFCQGAVIIYQASMEAIINEEWNESDLLDKVVLPDDLDDCSFAKKWDSAFEELDLDDSENLDPYITFYKEYRVPLTHPSRRHEIEDTQKIRFYNVYEGFKHGWNAYIQLLKGIGKESFIPETSNAETAWEMYCEMTNLPSDINEKDYPPIVSDKKNNR